MRRVIAEIRAACEANMWAKPNLVGLRRLFLHRNLALECVLMNSRRRPRFQHNVCVNAVRRRDFQKIRIGASVLRCGRTSWGRLGVRLLVPGMRGHTCASDGDFDLERADRNDGRPGDMPVATVDFLKLSWNDVMAGFIADRDAHGIADQVDLQRLFPKWTRDVRR